MDDTSDHLSDSLSCFINFRYIKLITYYGNDRKFMNSYFAKNSIFTDLEICIN